MQLVSDSHCQSGPSIFIQHLFLTSWRALGNTFIRTNGERMASTEHVAWEDNLGTSNQFYATPGASGNGGVLMSPWFKACGTVFGLQRAWWRIVEWNSMSGNLMRWSNRRNNQEMIYWFLPTLRCSVFSSKVIAKQWGKNPQLDMKFRKGDEIKIPGKGRKNFHGLCYTGKGKDKEGKPQSLGVFCLFSEWNVCTMSRYRVRCCQWGKVEEIWEKNKAACATGKERN